MGEEWSLHCEVMRMEMRKTRVPCSTPCPALTIATLLTCFRAQFVTKGPCFPPPPDTFLTSCICSLRRTFLFFHGKYRGSVWCHYLPSPHRMRRKAIPCHFSGHRPLVITTQPSTPTVGVPRPRRTEQSEGKPGGTLPMAEVRQKHTGLASACPTTGS